MIYIKTPCRELTSKKRQMNCRFDVLRIDGIWTLTDSGPETHKFNSKQAAITAAVAAAHKHHVEVGGSASVYVWHGPALVTEHFRVPDDRPGR